MGVFHKYFWSRRTLISWISRSGRLFLQTSKELERMEIGSPERGRMVIGNIHHCHYCWGPRVDHYIFAWTITVSANWGVMQHWISTPRLRFRSWGTAETCRKRYDKVTSYKPFSHLIHLHSITPITRPIFLPYSPSYPYFPTTYFSREVHWSFSCWCQCENDETVTWDWLAWGGWKGDCYLKHKDDKLCVKESEADGALAISKDVWDKII